jgi:CDK inhibitor PHO81
LNFANTQDIDQFVDRILKLVYDLANQRSIIFASFNASVCSVLNWKQPNYGVFFGSHCGFKAWGDGPWRSIMSGFKEHDIRCTSIKEAIRFAKANNLLGLITESTPLIQLPVLINTIKESGLLLASFGRENENESNVRKQETAGVDAIVVNRVLRYNIS